MKISKQKTYAINWLFVQGKTADEISSELDISINTVNQYLEQNAKSLNAQKPKPAHKEIKSGADLMITRTSGKNIKNVAIMTQEASAFNDNAKKKLIEQPTHKDYIYRPNKNK
jgi:DNA-binding NarL/FixJ family response regulator